MPERSPIEFVDPRQTPFVSPRSRGELPHLYKPNGSYFVTFRLYDALATRAERQEWERLQTRASRTPYLRDPEIARQLGQASAPPLRMGSCLLARSEPAAIVQNALLHFNEQRYQLTSWCVMPNHVHVTYTTIGRHGPGAIHHSWKSFSSHEINAVLSRKGSLWERESFDHLVRSIEHYEAFVRYIEDNPVVAGLCAHASHWPFSSASYYAEEA